MTTLPTVGPRAVALDVDPPVRAGPASLLCLEAPEGFSARAETAAFVPAQGEPVAVVATLAQEQGAARLALTVPSLRRVGRSSFLCLGTPGPVTAGLVFDRLTITAGKPLLLPQILWIEGAPAPR